MKMVHHLLLGFFAAFGLIGAYSCQQAGKNNTGSEFIPDMAHPTAYEANVYDDYSLHTWDKESVLSRRVLSQPRLPVNGTIPRGYTGLSFFDGVYGSPEETVLASMDYSKTGGGIAYPSSGHVPYHYPDTEDGRTLATQQIKYNPFPITQQGMATGQELYNIYCGICHGDKGDGGGYLVRDNGGKYPAQPANFLDSLFVNSSNGRYYHAIMYGKNAMGSHADKLSFKERWEVIHYIRYLQATAKGLKYNHEVNELNASYGVPEAKAKQLAEANKPKSPVSIGTTEEASSGDGQQQDGQHSGGGH